MMANPNNPLLTLTLSARSTVASSLIYFSVAMFTSALTEDERKMHFVRRRAKTMFQAALRRDRDGVLLRDDTYQRNMSKRFHFGLEVCSLLIVFKSSSILSLLCLCLARISLSLSHSLTRSLLCCPHCTCSLPIF